MKNTNEQNNDTCDMQMKKLLSITTKKYVSVISV